MDASSDIEALKRLKARYCRLLDAKDWPAWRELFTEDFHSDTSECGGLVIDGAEAFIAFVRKNLGAPQRVTVHQVHAPEIELTSATSASGIWALEDLVRLGVGLSMRGYGHYHEHYVKQDGRWRIRSSKLTRLREDIITPFFSFRLSGSLKSRLARLNGVAAAPRPDMA